MSGAILPLPQYAFMAWCSVKHRDNFTLFVTKDLQLHVSNDWENKEHAPGITSIGRIQQPISIRWSGFHGSSNESRVGSVCIRTRLGVGRPGPDFLHATASRPALGPTQPPIQWVPGVKRPGVKLTTHLHPVPRLKLRGAILPLPHLHGVVLSSAQDTSSWRGA
jgi:hypothetical protein